MGCCASASLASDPVEEKEPETPANVREAVAVDETHHKTVHERLRNLRELDSTTKVPFILIELTGEGDGEGEIEVTGKDEYGVYEALNNFFVHTWGCDPLDPGDETEDTKVPFCSAQYRWPGYSVKGDDGLNNQGLMTMRLIDFMCGNLSWTLAVVNGGNVGENRDVRETQLIFKAPHPMNLVAPHLLVEVRSAGFIEVCADLDEENSGILGSLDGYFADRFKASLIEGHEDFCDRYYEAGEGIFKGSGGSLDSNFGLLCTDVCDVITTHEGWSLVACNTGNYGADGRFSEQQMIFRRDYHPLGDSKYLQVILNALGNIEVNGQHVREIHSKLDGFFRGKWKCERAGHFREGDSLCRRYTWDVSELNMLRATADVVTFFELQGWEIQVASQQQVLEDGSWCREQQLLFRPGKTEVGSVEPHVFIELYAGEGAPELFEDEETTQVLANQRIRLRAIGPGSEKMIVSPQLRQVKQVVVLVQRSHARFLEDLRSASVTPRSPSKATLAQRGTSQTLLHSLKPLEEVPPKIKDSGTGFPVFAEIAAGMAAANVEERLPCLIFDWDDTLCPTWWMRSTLPHAGQEASPTQVVKLALHAGRVEQVLRAARSFGSVDIVTLANRQWLEQTSRFMSPGNLDLLGLFDELQIQVHHAYSRTSPKAAALSPSIAIQAKKDAMANVLEKYYGDSIKARVHVLSFGDQDAEATAIQELVKDTWATSWQRPLCKVIRLPQDPDMQDLGKSLQKILTYLPALVRAENDLDLPLSRLDTMRW